MVTRTFIQQGQGYGSAPADITVKIDGNVIFSGTVPTVNQPLPVLPDPNIELTSNLYSWTNEVLYKGQQDFELTVNSGTVILTTAIANYTITLDPVTGNLVPGNESIYAQFFREEVDGIMITDCFTEEKINGISQEEHPIPGTFNGQWWWTITEGSTFTALLNTDWGNVGV